MKNRLLIAEGDELLRDVYHRYFSNRGFDVETVDNAADCQRMLEGNPPDVAILKCDVLNTSDPRVLKSLDTSLDTSKVDLIVAKVLPTAKAPLMVIDYFREPIPLIGLLMAIAEALC